MFRLSAQLRLTFAGEKSRYRSRKSRTNARFSNSAGLRFLAAHHGDFGLGSSHNGCLTAWDRPGLPSAAAIEHRPQSPQQAASSAHTERPESWRGSHKRVARHRARSSGCSGASPVCLRPATLDFFGQVFTRALLAVSLGIAGNRCRQPATCHVTQDLYGTMRSVHKPGGSLRRTRRRRWRCWRTCIAAHRATHSSANEVPHARSRSQGPRPLPPKHRLRQLQVRPRLPSSFRLPQRRLPQPRRLLLERANKRPIRRHPK